MGVSQRQSGDSGFWPASCIRSDIAQVRPECETDKMTMYRNVFAAAAVTMLMSSQMASAALTVYTMEGDSSSGFVGALAAGTLKIEDFESLGGESPPVALPFGGASALATLSGPDKVSTADLNGRHSVQGGSNYWAGGAEPFEITFDTSLRAFGFWGTDIGDFSTDCPSPTAGCTSNGGALRVEFYKSGPNGDELVDFEVIDGVDSNGSELFRGYVASSADMSFYKVKFINLQTGWDGQGFDRLMFGEVTDQPPPPNGTPEPGMLALLGLGMLGVVATRRRR
jgi:hypothetical protein